MVFGSHDPNDTWIVSLALPALNTALSGVGNVCVLLFLYLRSSPCQSDSLFTHHGARNVCVQMARVELLLAPR